MIEKRWFLAVAVAVRILKPAVQYRYFHGHSLLREHGVPVGVLTFVSAVIFNILWIPFQPQKHNLFTS